MFLMEKMNFSCVLLMEIFTFLTINSLLKLLDGQKNINADWICNITEELLIVFLFLIILV